MQKMTRVKYQNERRKKAHRTRLRPPVFWFLFLAFLGIILYTTSVLLFWHHDNKEIKNLEENINSQVQAVEVEEQGTPFNPPEDKNSDYWYYINVPFYDVDFNNLIQKNSDTVAFIHVPNTNINYPVVQTGDNEYYLSHAYDKSKNSAGWVYMDYRNDKNFTDDNTIIYGHGRVNKTVFGSLKDTLTKEWQADKDNYVIQISTPSSNFVYQIFSIYTIESESYYITPHFSTNQEKEEWLSTMKNRNTASNTTDVNIQDKIITLSTCLNNSGGRIVVHGKLIKSLTK